MRATDEPTLPQPTIRTNTARILDTLSAPRLRRSNPHPGQLRTGPRSSDRLSTARPGRRLRPGPTARFRRGWDRGSWISAMDATEPQMGSPPISGPSERTAGHPPRALGQRHRCGSRPGRPPARLRGRGSRALRLRRRRAHGERELRSRRWWCRSRGRLRGHLVLARTGREFDSTEHDEAPRDRPGPQPLPSRPRSATCSSASPCRTSWPPPSAGTRSRPTSSPRSTSATARVTGVEALARWFHPERGVLPPSDFLDLAESGGLMLALTERIIELATRAAGDWWRSGLRLELSVNLPADVLAEPDPRLSKWPSRPPCPRAACPPQPCGSTSPRTRS